MGDPLRKTAVPPAAGWTLREAAEAFWPAKMQRLIKDHGNSCLPMFPAADELPADIAPYVRQERANVGITFRPIANDLIAALAKREDLFVAGYELHNLDGRRHELDVVTFRQAALFDEQFPGNVQIDLKIFDDIVRLYYRSGQKITKTRYLSRARILSRHPRADPIAKPQYTPALAMIWLTERFRGWPSGMRPPNADECHVAAQQHFADAVPKSPFQKLRREHPGLPQGWNTPGRPRKRRVL